MIMKRVGILISCLLFALFLMVSGAGVLNAAMQEVAMIAQIDAAAPNADAMVTVAHFAPFFATDVASTAVTITVNGGVVLTNTTFGAIAPALPLPAGMYTVAIFPGSSITPAITATVTVTDDTKYTLAAIGDGSNQPLELLALVDDTTPLTESAKLRIGHLAPFAANLAETAVDICTDSNTIVVPNVPYKVVTAPYLALPPGDYDLKIALAGTSCGTVALDLPSVRLAAGDIVDVFAVGLNNAAFPLAIETTTGLTLTPSITYLPLILEGVVTR